MTLSQLVTDLATSQRLCDAGFPQDTAMVWVKLFQEPWLALEVEQVLERKEVHTDYILCAAPTAGELEEWLMTKLPFSKRMSSIVVERVLLHAKDKEATYRVTGTGIGGLRIIVGKTAIVAALAALVLEVAG